MKTAKTDTKKFWRH